MFGGQSSGSLFAAPAASGSLFGAPSSGGLFGAGGAPQSSASLFGGQPAASGGLFGAAPSAAATAAAPAAGLFGAPAASSGGLFGAPAASSASLFGGPTASSGGLFGAPAATTGGLFGAPAASSVGLFGAPAASAGGLFGAPAASSASLLGTPASSGGLFGTPAASGGLFGAPASSASLFGAAPAASSGGLFGATPASSGGLFGATPAAASGGLFGGGGAATGGLFGASSGGGLFGASTGQVGLFGAAAPSAPGLFGAPAATAPASQPIAVPSGHDLAHSQAEQAAIKRSLQELQELCTPGSSNFKLTHLFLYVVGPEQKVRPPDVPQAQWEAALQRAGGAGNRSGLWPVPVRGLQQLKAHHDAQQGALQANRSCLAELQGLVQRLAQWDEAALRRRTQAIMDQHSNLSLRLLKVVRLVDALAVRIAGSAECRKMDQQLEALAKHIAHIEAQLAPNKVQGLQYQVDTVVAAAAAVDPSRSGTLSSTGVDQGTLQRAAHLLGEHNRGLEALQQHLQRVERDVALVHNELNRQMLTFVVPTSYPRKAS